MKTPLATRLTLLPRDPSQPAATLHLDATGTLLADSPTLPLAGASRTPRVREVVVVPGEAVRLLHLRIPTRAPAQALAAARLLAEDHVAGIGGLHVALSPPLESLDTPRLVALVDETAMAQWQQQCRALGLVPDAMIPDCLLLDAPADGGLIAAPLDGLLAVRGDGVAFTAEDSMAGLLAGERPLQRLEPAQVPAAFAAALHAMGEPVLDLLQFRHARQDHGGRRRRRRIAVLAALAALSPVAVAGTQTLRDTLWAHWMDVRADLVAVQHDPLLIASDDPSTSLHVQHTGRAAPLELARLSDALFQALGHLPGARLDSYEFSVATGLRVGLVHAGEADIETLRGHLAPHGIHPVALESQPVEDGTRSLLALETVR